MFRNVQRRSYEKALLAYFNCLNRRRRLGMSAKGQAVDQIVVKIPYDFVVAGKTLPAGTYRVNRLRDADPGVLILSSFENRTSAIVLPTTHVDSSSADQVQVSFERVGASTSSARSKPLIMRSPFQCPVRKSWKPQQGHKAARLPREIRLETRSSIHANGAACGSPLFPFLDRAI